MPLDRDASARSRTVCLTMVLMSTGTSRASVLRAKSRRSRITPIARSASRLMRLTDSNCSPSQLVLEQQLGEGGDAGERIIELVRDAGDELADGGQLFRASEVVGDLALLGEISDADTSPTMLSLPSRMWLKVTAAGNSVPSFSGGRARRSRAAYRGGWRESSGAARSARRQRRNHRRRGRLSHSGS